MTGLQSQLRPSSQHRPRRATFALWLLLLCVCQSCTCSPSGFVRMHSGDKNDDNIEEPLAAMAKPYEPLLKASNDMVKMLREGKFDEFYKTRVDASLQKSFTQPQLKSLYEGVLGHIGAPVSVKPMQWAFEVVKGGKGSHVTSSKIVIHERGRAYYRFTFAGEHDTKLIGLHFRVPPTPAAATK